MTASLATLTTHSTLCETTREGLQRDIARVREEGLSVPRAVHALNLNREDHDANAISAAVTATNARLRDDAGWDAMHELWFQLGHALQEVTREPARGGGQS